ncbi:two-component system response regulator [Salegentibacter salinarum]|uniref:Two-component system response regulator n=1 Tax=Salegentibacter salinarum TaxID=447422 RepID=A0A2N0TQR3_9FLAO|nr:response regulator [Salegentibacter salinarum]PKD17075.1 two-component system response regulator [Salegentibacter salinarum]SKB54613.1 CheY chemotaxis protein or a CheY-like REC (receiver) domain [Salegentibacter salinarum]
MESIHILLVEDNEGDILLTSEALEDGKILNKLSVVRDGKEAMDFLDKKGKHVKAITPDLILLDVNLPKMNGHEVLKFVKQHKDLKQIPVIMLTTSSSKEDIDISYQNYANCYITKPIEVEDFMKAVNQIEEFWVNLVKHPSK